MFSSFLIPAYAALTLASPLTIEKSCSGGTYIVDKCQFVILCDSSGTAAINQRITTATLDKCMTQCQTSPYECSAVNYYPDTKERHFLVPGGDVNNDKGVSYAYKYTHKTCSD